MVSDAHVHLAGAVVAGEKARGTAELLAAMDTAGVDSAFVMGLDTGDSPAVSNGELDQDPRLVSFMVPKIGLRTGCDVADAVRFREVRGLGEFYVRPGASGLPADYLQPVLDAARQHHLPVLLHTGEFSYTAPIMLLGMIQAYPDLTFIIGHMGSPTYVLDAIELAKRYPNVLLETSGMPSPSMLRRAVIECGADRVLFGSDYPFWHPEVERARVEAAGLGRTATQQVLGENALQLLLRSQITDSKSPAY
jgi:uncharacterized protein